MNSFGIKCAYRKWTVAVIEGSVSPEVQNPVGDRVRTGGGGEWGGGETAKRGGRTSCRIVYTARGLVYLGS